MYSVFVIFYIEFYNLNCIFFIINRKNLSLKLMCETNDKFSICITN